MGNPTRLFKALGGLALGFLLGGSGVYLFNQLVSYYA